MLALREVVPSGTILCGHAGWRVLLPCKTLAADFSDRWKIIPTSNL